MTVTVAGIKHNKRADYTDRLWTYVVQRTSMNKNTGETTSKSRKGLKAHIMASQKRSSRKKTVTVLEVNGTTTGIVKVFTPLPTVS